MYFGVAVKSQWVGDSAKRQNFAEGKMTFFRKKGSILRHTSRFRGKRAFSEANQSYDFPYFSHSISSFLHPLLHPLEPGALSAKSGTAYNHPNQVTGLEPISKKSGKRRAFEESPTPCKKLSETFSFFPEKEGFHVKSLV